MPKREPRRRETTQRAAFGTDRDPERDPQEERSDPAPERPSLEDEIRLRAYYRYLLRDGESEDAVTDWLEAEADVLGRHATGVDAPGRVSDEAGLD